MKATLTAHDFPEKSLLRIALGDPRFTRLLEFFEPFRLDQGAVLIHEGDHESSTYLIQSGGVSIAPAGSEVIRTGEGDLVGGLAWLPRGTDATVVVTEPSDLALLTSSAWQKVCREEPEIALKALRAMRTRADQKPSTPNLEVPVAAPEQTVFVVNVSGKSEPIASGTRAVQLLPTRVDDKLVVAALIDRKAVSLTTPITSACDLEPLTTSTLNGQRYFRQSQALLLLEAAHQIDPSLRPRLSHSLGFAQRVELDSDNSRSLQELAVAIDERMQSLVLSNQPLNEEWYSVAEARQIFEDRGWTSAADQLTVWRSAVIKMVSYGELFVKSPGPLVPVTGMIGAARLVADGDVLLLVYGKEGGRPIVGTDSGTYSQQQPVAATGRFAAVSAYRMAGPAVQEQRKWLAAVGISSVGEFNQACINGDVSQIIRVSEGFQEKRIGAIADQIADRGHALKVVAVAGPSSSGKTTFIRRLKVQLQVNGLSPVELSLDDYYCNREDTPLDSEGEYDYESIDALQLDLLKLHLERLTNGEAVQTPRYDFQSGKSLMEGPRIQLGPTDVLLVEGIHGLNPMLLQAVPEKASFGIFICPLTQLPFDPLTRVHVSDVRLLRRIVRDRFARSAPAADTILRWSSVRAGERLNIFPFHEYADAVFDSSLIYELAVLKVYAERYLLEVPRGHEAYTTANRLLHLISCFVSIYPDHVPPTSLLCEFIGGSSFEH